MPGGVVNGLAERFQLLHRVLSHHAPRRRKLGVLDPVLFPLPISEVGLCLGLPLRLEEHSPRFTSFAEADVISQVWSFWIMVLANLNLPPPPQEDERRIRIFVCHVFVCCSFSFVRVSDKCLITSFSCKRIVVEIMCQIESLCVYYELL